MSVCGERGCPNLAHYRGRCELHARQRNRETRSQNRKVYGSQKWLLTRRRYLFDHPLCECEDDCGRIAEDVHHKLALQHGGDPWNADNLEALTHACHSKVTRREMATP